MRTLTPRFLQDGGGSRGVHGAQVVRGDLHVKEKMDNLGMICQSECVATSQASTWRNGSPHCGMQAMQH